MFIHVVKSRETLWQIANTYHVYMTAIVEVNGLPNPNQLVVGQALVIPSEDIFHTVKIGESLWGIAQTYGTTIQRILQNNQIVSPANIFPGLLIYIPAYRYRIQSGDTLWGISQKYGVPVQNIVKANNIIDIKNVYPGTILVIPNKNKLKPPINVNGYIYFFGEDAVPIIKEDGEHLTYMSPFAYLIKQDGSLQSINDIPAIQTAKTEAVIPMMSITNFTSTTKGENLAHIIFTSPQIIENLFVNIINSMKEKGYLGINIDFENVIPTDREAYNSFLQLAVTRLHSEGFFVSTAVAPKVSGDQLLYEAHDYEAHGRIADFVILMTYEWGCRKCPPQAISPLNEIKKVLNYAITVIPKGKIYFGYQIYARDWLLPYIEGQEAETFSAQEAIIRAVKYGTVILYDSVAQSPFYQYKDEQGRSHQVWFEDARSAQAKFNLMKSYNLKGISYWALGYPFPQNWALLEDNFTIQK